MLSVRIDDVSYEFQEGITLLQAFKTAGINVPALCDDQRLKPVGACRMCAVQVSGSARPVISCTTPLEQGMDIHTHPPQIEELRKTTLGLLVHTYPAESYRKYPDHPFHQMIHRYGLESELSEFKNLDAADDLHPYICVDMSRCIQCYRCVRICEEVQGQFVWKVWNRGDSTQISVDSGANLLGSSCVSCGACVDTCPTGALQDQTLCSGIIPDRWTSTTCAYCGTGCELNVGTSKERIVTIRPVLDGPVSKGHLCVKGRYSFQFATAPDRITRPMIRKNREWVEVSWNEAIGFVAENLNRILEEFGPDSIGMLGSARATNEDNYITQKFARTVLGTNNVDCCARVCHGPTATGMKQALGTGASTNSFNDIEQARTILVCGANPTENHPVIGARIKQAARKGAHLIVIDPRRIELTQFANVHLQPVPGTNIPLLASMANVIIQEHLCDELFVKERVSGMKEFWNEISFWTPQRAAAACKVHSNQILEAAHLYAKEKPAMIIHGLGVTEHTQGTETVMCLVNLSLLTGNIGKPGSGVNPLRGQNNVQGSAHMGCEPDHLTGYVALEKSRKRFESIWGITVPTNPGLNLMQMLDSAANNQLKALWIIGYDIRQTNPFGARTRNELANLDFVIVQDLFLTETAREFGSVFLPVCSSFEKEGTFMNAERRIQPVRKVIEPPGDVKPDWQVLCEIAQAMVKGKYFAFENAREIWNEIRAVWPAGNGITYERLEQGGLQWPCATENDSGTAILHQTEFSSGKQAALKLIAYSATKETTDPDYPFLLITGRTLYHFNAGTMTKRTKNVDLQEVDLLDINPEDAERLQIQNRQRVRLRSRYGHVELPARVNSSVAKGQVFSTFHNPELFLNNVTGPYSDRFTGTPEYKITAVRLEKL